MRNKLIVSFHGLSLCVGLPCTILPRFLGMMRGSGLNGLMMYELVCVCVRRIDRVLSLMTCAQCGTFISVALIVISRTVRIVSFVGNVICGMVNQRMIQIGSLILSRTVASCDTTLWSRSHLRWQIQNHHCTHEELLRPCSISQWFLGPGSFHHYGEMPALRGTATQAPAMPWLWPAHWPRLRGEVLPHRGCYLR